MHAYTLASVASVAAVVALELAWLRTGLLRRHTYWIALAIVVFFQCLVDGWLTKLSAPVVIYAGGHFSGLRLPWDIPVEDFAFGWALVTLCLLLWERQSGPADATPGPDPVVRRL
jgi:lycopene cyclase domain-containing protein